MLDLNNPIVYSAAETATINNVMATGNSGPDMWADGRVHDVKHHISVHTLTEQGCLCAYCEALLEIGTTSIEHFVPKSRHREFTFEPLNLTSACGRCNATAIKGSKETIVGAINPNYSSNTFKIVHPRLDNPNAHIIFQDADRTIFDKVHCSQLGLDTIDFFEWDNLDAYLVRVQTTAVRNLPNNIRQLISEISTYK